MGIFGPEKKATRIPEPEAHVAIHCVSSEPHSVFLCWKRLSAGMLRRERLPPPGVLGSASNAALASAAVRARIWAIVNPEKLMISRASAMEMSPVMALASELEA